MYYLQGYLIIKSLCFINEEGEGIWPSQEKKNLQYFI